ncbi:MAG: DUF262 domain-containing protein [Microcystis sp. LE19-196.1B]|nr:DUF262 domain-containing protein [Microcystis sp. LE19-196.1B]
MSKINFLHTTHHNIAWFKKAHDIGDLDMKPPYQRNPVWVNKQKSYLIDTILNGYPVPEIYMQEVIDSSGNSKQIIVDGQQRIRACLDFVYDKFPMDEEDSPDFANLFFSEMKDNLKKSIFEYEFVIRILPDLPEAQIRAIFQRLNKNVVALNAQELRQATYWGSFIKTMNELSNLDCWKEYKIFTQNDIRRMLDVEYISELSIATLHGFQNKKESIDEYYTLYEEEFEQREYLINIFNKVTFELLQAIPEISKTRWTKKTDFYTLFLYLAKNSSKLPLSSEKRRQLNSSLIDFGQSIDNYLSTNSKKIEAKETVEKYGSNVRASSDLSPRKKREEALSEEFKNLWD